MCTLWIDGVTLKVQWQIFARRNMSKNGGRRMTFLGHARNQATTPAVKEPSNWGKKGNRPFAPVTPLVLIGSQHPVLCGKLNLSNTSLHRVSWVVFSRSCWSICFQLVFVCVCGHCVCLLSPFDGLIWAPLCHQQGFCSHSSHCHQLPCGWSGTICSRRVLNTPQQHGPWDGLNGAYAALIDFHIFRASPSSPITNQGTARHTRPRDDREVYSVLRETSLRLRFLQLAGYSLRCL